VEVKLISVTIEGFQGFVSKVELDLDGLGLVHIAGINEDDPGSNSNGAAKTTIL
jgi:predicted RNA-binding protein with RPS1 domain